VNANLYMDFLPSIGSEAMSKLVDRKGVSETLMLIKLRKRLARDEPAYPEPGGPNSRTNSPSGPRPARHAHPNDLYLGESSGREYRRRTGCRSSQASQMISMANIAVSMARVASATTVGQG